jgi:hypothetical protein
MGAGSSLKAVLHTSPQTVCPGARHTAVFAYTRIERGYSVQVEA